MIYEPKLSKGQKAAQTFSILLDAGVHKNSAMLKLPGSLAQKHLQFHVDSSGTEKVTKQNTKKKLRYKCIYCLQCTTHSFHLQTFTFVSLSITDDKELAEAHRRQSQRIEFCRPFEINYER